MPPSSSPMRRPVSNPAGRGGIRPPSHQVSWSAGIFSRAGNWKRTIVERGNISFFGSACSKNACQYLEMFGLHADRVLQLQRPEEGVDDVAAHVAERAGAEVPPARHFAGW